MVNKTQCQPQSQVADVGSRPRRRSAGRVAVGVSALAVALAVPVILSPPAMAMCRVDQDCTRTPRPPISPTPANSPNLTIDTARETTSLDAVRITGWTSDADQPATALQVTISIDGQQVKTVTASLARSDVGAHGFDVTVPASHADHSISVTAVNVGSGSNTTKSVAEDLIARFAANSVEYDLARAEIVASTPQQLNRIRYSNGSTVNQTWQLDLTGSTTETSGWQNSQKVDVSASTSLQLGVPFFADGQVQVKLDTGFTWQQSGQTQVTKTWAFKQTTTVPAMSELVASSSVSETTLRVPYVLRGSWVYGSGHTESGTTSGTYTGTNSHDMVVTLVQTSLVSGATQTTERAVSASVSYSAPQLVAS